MHGASNRVTLVRSEVTDMLILDQGAALLSPAPASSSMEGNYVTPESLTFGQSETNSKTEYEESDEEEADRDLEEDNGGGQGESSDDDKENYSTPVANKKRRASDISSSCVDQDDEVVAFVVNDE